MSYFHGKPDIFELNIAEFSNLMSDLRKEFSPSFQDCRYRDWTNVDVK